MGWVGGSTSARRVTSELRHGQVTRAPSDQVRRPRKKRAVGIRVCDSTHLAKFSCDCPSNRGVRRLLLPEAHTAARGRPIDVSFLGRFNLRLHLAIMEAGGAEASLDPLQKRQVAEMVTNDLALGSDVGMQMSRALNLTKAAETAAAAAATDGSDGRRR